MADRRTILSLIGFRFQQGAWRFESISIADEAIDGLDEQTWQAGTARWWRREPSLPGREVIGDVPDITHMATTSWLIVSFGAPGLIPSGSDWRGRGGH